MSRLAAFTQRVDTDNALIASAMRPLALPDGSTMRVARLGAVGKGPVVVCVPTVAELNFVYVPMIRELGDRFEFVLYEPALSFSRRIGVSDRQDEILALIDALGGAPVHLMAWSDGGSAAYRLAAQDPERVVSLLLLGLADRYRLPGPLNLLLQGMDRFPLHRVTPTILVRLLLAWFMGGPQVPRRWFLAESRRIRPFVPFVKYSLLPCMTDHAPRANEIGVPTLLVGGDNDALVSVGQLRGMASLLGSHARFVLVPGGEHLLGYASPAPVNRAVREFLDEQNSTAPAATRPRRTTG